MDRMAPQIHGIRPSNMEISIHGIFMGYTVNTYDIWVSLNTKWLFLPSGKRLHNYGKSPFYSWVNPL